MWLSTIGKVLNRNIINQPVFVIGQGRSGTTALLRAVSLHPQVLSSPFESPVIRHYAEIAYYYTIEEADYYPLSTPIRDDLFLDKIKWDLYSTFSGLDYGAARILRDFLKLDKSHRAKNRWCAKVFPNEMQFEGLDRLFPEARYVYIFRNGIDQIHSSMAHPSFAGRNFEFYCKSWTDHARKYSYLSEEEKCFSLRHEELVESPAGVLKNLFEHLSLSGFEISSDYLSKNLIHPLDKNSHQANVKDSIKARKNPYQDWTKRQQETFNRVCGDMMKQLGYEVSA